MWPRRPLSSIGVSCLTALCESSAPLDPVIAEHEPRQLHTLCLLYLPVHRMSFGDIFILICLSQLKTLLISKKVSLLNHGGNTLVR